MGAQRHLLSALSLGRDGGNDDDDDDDASDDDYGDDYDGDHDDDGDDNDGTSVSGFNGLGGHTRAK